ncbi:MAG: glycerol-3-phosphate dehydrogenase/oxidase [Bradymonadia bacterium]
MSDYDVIVIGGGVNGVGIARDAALRGLKVALFEQNDLGAGTSGASSGMIHGGIRYLEKDRDVTRLSCLDSGYIQAIAPHLLFRIPFILPIQEWTPAARRLHELAYVYFQAYDEFQPLKRGKRAAKLDRDEVFRLEPGVPPGTIGGVTTDEWAINVFRLCVLNALDAQQNGAQIHLRHRVEGFVRDDTGKVLGVQVRDLTSGHLKSVTARITFNASGPWANRLAKLAGAEVKMRPGKGIHLVFDRRIVNYALIAYAVDNRQVFIEPYGQETWIGTTDDDYYGDPAEVQANFDEVRYLLEAVETVYPDIRKHRLTRAFAGVRPTLHKYGPYESDLSRRHEVFDHGKEGAPGLMSMGGGKLAAYRQMAAHATDEICSRLGVQAQCTTHTRPLPGGESTPEPKEIARAANIDLYAAARMVHRHGARCAPIVERITRQPRERRLLCLCEPVTEAEARFVIETEWVSSLEDLRRRTHCGGGACQGARCARQAACLLAEMKGQGPGEARRLLDDFVKARWREQAPVAGFGNRQQLEMARWNLKPGAEEGR